MRPRAGQAGGPAALAAARARPGRGSSRLRLPRTVTVTVSDDSESAGHDRCSREAGRTRKDSKSPSPRPAAAPQRPLLTRGQPAPRGPLRLGAGRHAAGAGRDTGRGAGACLPPPPIQSVHYTPERQGVVTCPISPAPAPRSWGAAMADESRAYRRLFAGPAPDPPPVPRSPFRRRLGPRAQGGPRTLVLAPGSSRRPARREGGPPRSAGRGAGPTPLPAIAPPTRARSRIIIKAASSPQRHHHHGRIIITAASSLRRHHRPPACSGIVFTPSVAASPLPKAARRLIQTPASRGVAGGPHYGGPQPPPLTQPAGTRTRTPTSPKK